MTFSQLEELKSLANPDKAAGMASYHKARRTYLGISVPQITDLSKKWRAELDVEARVALADALWQSDIHEARIAAAKLLTQARLRPDEGAWALICSWVPDFDAWAIADHACDAGQRRLLVDPSRIDTVEAWTTSEAMWTRRASLVITLPWTKQNNPKPQELEVRDRVLGWAAAYVDDQQWFIQKAIAWWLRELSKHDTPRVMAFLDAHGDRLKPFARKEAGKYLAKQ
ncbi:DNA alkylation repair protein [Heliomarina baculiformis]|uniref:DNA alkylation repair protein n=1 Tax=Heliomarina baculiformis TaxID=2872036 RepID=UPI001EE2051D|nr:DNA alkylation repair protein [Heliomarina baculiformis]